MNCNIICTIFKSKWNYKYTCFVSFYSISAEQLTIVKTEHLVKLGGEVEIECIGKIDKPILEVFWEQNGGKSIQQQIKGKNSPEKYSLRSIKSQMSLTVKQVDKIDVGTYRCFVKYDEKKFLASNATELKLIVEDGKLLQCKVHHSTSMKATL